MKLRVHRRPRELPRDWRSFQNGVSLRGKSNKYIQLLFAAPAVAVAQTQTFYDALKKDPLHRLIIRAVDADPQGIAKKLLTQTMPVTALVPTDSVRTRGWGGGSTRATGALRRAARWPHACAALGGLTGRHAPPDPTPLTTGLCSGWDQVQDGHAP